ncbi:MAG: ATP-binding cassette domain-containing protein, partial [Myxococcota bacterium]|nr:ATP-binding cassette domain-containing protein [Myxococcota bacterium]
MISFNRVGKQFGPQILFTDANFQINPGEKVGLVGANGSGKSTIFRLITSEEGYDEGHIEMPKRMTIGYFRQDVGEYSGRTVLEETKAGA